MKKLAAMRGGGSALPGLFVEKIDPAFVSRTLAQLPEGVVVVSGTNGKTTTTKMVVELLEDQGFRVFTNRTGSNFVRGVAAALLGKVNAHGELAADIAVLELDEAHAVHFVRAVKPRFSLLLNVMRDQLDRFGEIDTIARLLKSVADATSEQVIINREDPRLLSLASQLPAEKRVLFGLSSKLEPEFPDDDAMRGGTPTSSAKKPSALVILESLNGQKATFSFGGAAHTLQLQLDGVYNVYNAAAALALVSTVCGDQLNKKRLFSCLERVKPAFGRGEILTVNGQRLELVLVKNPSGFRLSLKSFPPHGYATMVAINDNYADGRDMSWLWDVDFDSLQPAGVAAVSGIRAYDMALRLQYDEVDVSHVDTHLTDCLRHFIKAHPGVPKRIFCSYTAMLHLRRELAKITDVEAIS